jgi:hypothetical protein
MADDPAAVAALITRAAARTAEPTLETKMQNL